MTLSYLVSTAGHAQYQNEVYPHSISSLTQLIREGAEELGDRHVVGFAEPLKDGKGTEKKDEEGRLLWQCHRLSFKDILALSDSFSRELIKLGMKEYADGRQPIVSLLAPTGLDFLVAWVACMGLGYGVAFIALAASAKELIEEIPTVRLPEISLANLGSEETHKDWPADATDPSEAISHIFHTSGTSGTPKPIPQTHSSSMVPLPRRKAGDPDTLISAFTTTPLFHGGVSDLLRAWMARSMLYLYPSSTTPVTASNVTGAFKACDMYDLGATYTPPIKAFLSVPYILTLLSPAADPSDTVGATSMLANMDIVSTGGAPLDTAVGDALVAKGVNLTSRLGSSECGCEYRLDYVKWRAIHGLFLIVLMTSYRDYENDKEWEWLRNDSPYASALKFEQSESDSTGRKLEMIVTSEWKSKAWLLAQVKSNRENGDYATGDLYERHPDKPNVWKYAGRGDDIVVLSNGEKFSPSPIEAVFRSFGDIKDALVIGVNKTQIGCLIFPWTFNSTGRIEAELENLIRSANEHSPSHAQLAKEMCSIISSEERANALPKSSKGTIQRGLAYDEFKPEIERLFQQAEGGQVESGEKQQLDSKELRQWLRQRVNEIVGSNKRSDGNEQLGEETDLFSWGVDSVKAARLRFAILQKIDLGGNSLPLNAVFEYSSIAQTGQQLHRRTLEDDIKLMRQMVDKYSDFESANDSVNKIICLVRGADEAVAYGRVQRALAHRNLQCQSDRFQVLAARLGKPNLGLDEAVYQSLAHTSVLNGTTHSDTIYEKLSEDPHTAVPIGYSQSKWVTEQICANANESTMLKDKVQVVRIGQLCGDTQEGIWNESEGWPLMIKSAQITGTLPMIRENPSWLPVDIAAKAVIDIAMKQKTCHKGRLPVFHVANPQLTTWPIILDGLAGAGLKFSTVAPHEWVQKVKGSEGDAESNPTKGMLGMWEKA
ncbi:putative NRPS-like protein biosynthetic cluster, partial [Naganishia cerealis]